MSIDLLSKAPGKHQIARSGTSHCPGCQRCNHMQRNFNQYILSKVKNGVSKNELKLPRPS